MINGIGGFGGGMGGFGRIDPEQMRKRRFQSIDANEDGSLGADELASMSEQMNQAGAPAFDFDSYLKAADTDGNGAVSDEEDRTFFQSMHERPKPPAFDEVDANGDGYLDRDELEALSASQTASGAPAMDIDRLLGDADTDQDGRISAGEDEAFRATMESRRGEGPGMPPPPPPGEDEESSLDGGLNDLTSMILDLLKKAQEDDGTSESEKADATALAKMIQQMIERYQFSSADSSGISTISSSGMSVSA